MGGGEVFGPRGSML